MVLPLVLSVRRTAVVKHLMQLSQVRHLPLLQLRSLDAGPNVRGRRLVGETEILCSGAGVARQVNLGRTTTAEVRMKGREAEILGYFGGGVQPGPVARLVQVDLRAVAL